MKIGLITVRGPKYHPNQRLAEAAENCGHKAILIHPYRIWPVIEKGDFKLANLPEDDFPEAVLPRQGSSIGDSCLWLIRHFYKMGLPIINRPKAIETAKNQFLSLQKLASSGIDIPETVFINAPEGFTTAVSWLGGFPVVAKQVSSRQGSGVMLLKKAEDVDRCIDEHFNPKDGLIVQQFIPPRDRRELRVMIIGNQIAGAMELTPKPGDFRGNYHLSGTGKWVELTSPIRELAIGSAVAIGLEIAGVELITDTKGKTVVIEVNYSPGFKGMESVTGLNIARKIIDYIVHRRAEPLAL